MVRLGPSNLFHWNEILTRTADQSESRRAAANHRVLERTRVDSSLRSHSRLLRSRFFCCEHLDAGRDGDCCPSGAGLSEHVACVRRLYNRLGRTGRDYLELTLRLIMNNSRQLE